MMLPVSKTQEDGSSSNATDVKPRRMSDTKGPRRRSSALRFFASNSPPKPDIQAQSHKQWESDYLKDLRANRPARPGGSRPLPAKTDATPEPYARAASALSCRQTPSKIDSSDPKPVVQERAASALSHRRAQSDMPKLGLLGSLNRRPWVQSPHMRRSTRDFSASTSVAKESTERSAIPYRESGIRWMEKQEARSLREALEEMDVREEAKIHAGAQDEASELVWQHINESLPDQHDRPRRDYTEHLREGAHARSQSQGWYQQSKQATVSKECGVSSAKGDGTGRSGDGIVPAHDGNTNASIGAKDRVAEKQQSSGQTHVKWDSPEKKAYTSLAYQVPPLRSTSRRSSGTKRRQPSGGPFHNPDDKIFEDGDNSLEAQNSRPAKISKIPLPSSGKAADQVSNPQTPAKKLWPKALDSTDKASRTYRSEIQRNPPSQSRNPSYLTNEKPEPETSNEDKKLDLSTQAKDKQEVRSDDIRAATSMRFGDRSPKLPSPSYVSSQPGRPIVSFDKGWKPRDTGKGEKLNTTPANVEDVGKRPRLPPPGSTASAPLVPTISVSDEPSISVDAAPKTSTPPSTSITADSVPTISLPNKQRSQQPGPAKRTPANRPLPHHSSTTPAHTSVPHWSLASQRSTAQCAACALPIAGRIVSAASQRFHPHCFSCHHCSEPLECVAFYPEPDTKRAERLTRIQARLDSNDLPEDKPGEAAVDDGDDSLRFYCHLDFHELFSPRCRSCKTPIESEVVVACGGTWHFGHFFCAECGDPFDSKTPFVEKNGYAWCVACHTGRFSGKCKGCRKPVTEQGVHALGAEWHENCFVCVECKGGFENGRFFTREDEQKPVCVKCEERRLKA